MNISSLQTDYINLDSSSDSSRNIERAHVVQTKCTFIGGVNHSAEKCSKRIRKEDEKARAVDVSSNRHTERTPRKCFRCGSEDHIIENFPKQVCLNEKVNRAYENGENNDYHKIYASMSQMSSNDERSSEKYGDSLQLTNWILYSGATCHMKPEVSDFIPGSLEDTDK